MPKRNQFDGREDINQEILSALLSIAEGQDRLNDNIQALSQNVYRQDVEALPALPQGGSSASISGSINQAAGMAAKNPLTELSSSLLNFQKAIEGAANTIGSVLTNNLDLRGRYNVSQTAEQQTMALYGQMAAFGYEASSGEIADTYMQFEQIKRREFEQRRRVERITSRGSFLFGAMGLGDLGLDIKETLQDVYNLGYKSEDTLNNELQSLAKTREQAKMQKEVNRNNAVHDQGGY